jgi:hypothetical protein
MSNVVVPCFEKLLRKNNLKFPQNNKTNLFNKSTYNLFQYNGNYKDITHLVDHFL